MADAKLIPRTGLGTKILYGLGSVAFGIKDGGFGFFLLFFYNAVLGLSGTLVGVAIAIAIVADAVLDPIIGEISDNWRSRLGRRHPFMYGAAVPVAVFYFMLWNPPHWQSWALFAYLVVIAVLVRVSIACYEIPSAALAPELTPDYDDRTSLMAFRWLFGALGNGAMLAVTLTFFMVATKAQPTGMLNQHGYFRYGLLAVVVMAASILLSAAGTHARGKRMRQAPSRQRPTTRQIAREMFESLSHRSLLMVTLSGLFSGMALGMGSVLNTYFFTYFWYFTPQQLSVMGLGALIATAIAVPLSSLCSARLGKKRGVVLTAFSSLVVNNIAMTLKLLGFLPPAGSAALLLILFTTVTTGLALAITSGILVTSMITDVVEDSELKTGRRSEGLFSATLSFVGKATSGLGILAGSVLLDIVAFPKNVAPSVMAVQAPHAVYHLVLIYMPVQLALWIVAITLVNGYRIDRATHEHNLQRLAEAAALAEVSPAGELVGGSAVGGADEGVLLGAARTAAPASGA